ncbi:MAG: beta-ketoacyl synthase chain length factor [Gammaproteobacteria bacterium]|nr:beta-ketoacyl synthase chain length factor [Gammaproteobacteria bacterium]
MTTLYLDNLGVVAPGLSDWPGAAKVLRGEADHLAEPLKLTAPELLPATERRRSSDSTRLALRAAEQALSLEAAQRLQPAAVFSSAYGDPTITHKLCELLSGTPPMASPTLFHNSVHNAPAGYWSIATANPMTTTSIAAGDESFATGLLYAAAQVVAEQRPVLLISYDLPYPKPLSEKCEVSAPFASALLLSHQASAQSIAQLSLSLDKGPETIMDLPLESLRRGNPAARALPLLAILASASGECLLPYLAEQRLHITVTPCR